VTGRLVCKVAQSRKEAPTKKKASHFAVVELLLLRPEENKGGKTQRG